LRRWDLKKEKSLLKREVYLDGKIGKNKIDVKFDNRK
jgi:hypothetical protein